MWEFCYYDHVDIDNFQIDMLFFWYCSCVCRGKEEKRRQISDAISLWSIWLRRLIFFGSHLLNFIIRFISIFLYFIIAYHFPHCFHHFHPSFEGFSHVFFNILFFFQRQPTFFFNFSDDEISQLLFVCFLDEYELTKYVSLIHCTWNYRIKVFWMTSDVFKVCLFKFSYFSMRFLSRLWYFSMKKLAQFSNPWKNRYMKYLGFTATRSNCLHSDFLPVNSIN